MRQKKFFTKKILNHLPTTVQEALEAYGVKFCIALLAEATFPKALQDWILQGYLEVLEDSPNPQTSTK